MSSYIRSFGCLNIATSFSVWRYIFKMSRSPLSFKVIISRPQQWKNGLARVYALLGQSLIIFASHRLHEKLHFVVYIVWIVVCTASVKEKENAASLGRRMTPRSYFCSYSNSHLEKHHLVTWDNIGKNGPRSYLWDEIAVYCLLQLCDTIWQCRLSSGFNFNKHLWSPSSLSIWLSYGTSSTKVYCRFFIF